MRDSKNTLISGTIYLPLIRFMLPVMLAAFLQALYGAVDLIVIGRFISADPLIVQNATAAVGTGSMIMVLITYIISGLTMGVTVTLGKYIGADDRNGATKTVGAAIGVFAVFTVILTVIMELGAPLFARWMNAPDVDLTVQYVRICSAGLIFITAYNATSGLFRGIGNSVLPLTFVAVASVVNIVLDLLLVCVIPLGVSGVAIATVTAQAVSVLLSLFLSCEKRSCLLMSASKPFAFTKKRQGRFSKPESPWLCRIF